MPHVPHLKIPFNLARNRLAKDVGRVTLPDRSVAGEQVLDRLMEQGVWALFLVATSARVTGAACQMSDYS